MARQEQKTESSSSFRTSAGKQNLYPRKMIYAVEGREREDNEVEKLPMQESRKS